MSESSYKTLSYTLIAFIAGFAVLAVEMTGIRLIAGTLGNSIYTWSALIAAILLSMSFGSMVGGTLIDRSLHIKWLLGALVFAAFTTSLAPFLANMANARVGAMEVTEGALFECALIFALPSFAYGAIPPLCVKLLSAAGKSKKVGFSAGIISMAGSLGSFAGALATPFWLIPHLSLTSIFLCIAAMVVLSSFLLIKSAPFTPQTTVFLAAIGAGLLFAAVTTRANTVQPPLLFDETTPYHRIRVEEQREGDRRGRFLLLDTTLEGGIIAGEQTLPLEYQNTWQLVKRMGIPVRRALCIGAGAFGVPERLSEAYPDAIIDVSEIDPRVIHAGVDFFDLGKFPHIQPVAADGRLFLNRCSTKYDLIFIDAYHGIRYIPPQLTTAEFFHLCQEHLSPHGIVMMNIISSLTGPSDGLFRTFGATVKSVFPFCGAIPMKPSDPREIQNIVLVCASASWDRNAGNVIMDVSNWIPMGERVMTDQKNPIEAILARQLRQRE